MVKLSFSSQILAPLPKVWQYFSKFENLEKWDPNITSIVIKNKTINQIGSTYQVKSIWKGQEQQFLYKMTEYVQMRKITVQGQNSITKCVDQIFFQQKQPGKTIVTYKADISLKHFFKIMTPFIKDDLVELQKSAENGFNKKCKQLFG